jgi:tetratricopeptide (TPR) repeat protein
VPDLPAGALERSGRAPEVWGKIPQQNRNFTGRKELLERLHAGIAKQVTAVVPEPPVPHTLHGLGGVGKTQVAIEYAHRYRGEYGLVWWISADQPVLLLSSLAALAPHLGLPSATAIGIEDCASAVIKTLESGHPYDKWLLIFDNADQPEDLKDLLPKGPGHILITSRNRRWQELDTVDTVAVNVFTRQESVEFLKKRVPGDIDSGDADRLAEALGDLPLALEQAGALQAETGMAIDEYLRQLTEHATLLLGEGRQTEYPVSMTAAWSLSVSQLKNSLPEAIELLRCCAFFGPEPIPLDVFVPVSAEVGAKPLIAIDPKMRALLSNPVLLTRAINQLGRFALARIDDWTRSLQVHRLVQALLRDELDPAEQTRIRHQVHLLLAGAAITRAPDENQNWDRYLELLAHAVPARINACHDPFVRKFCLDLVRYLYSSGDYKTSRSLVQQLIEEWEGDPEADVRDAFTAKWHLGNVVRALGEDTFDLNRQTLEQMTSQLGADDRVTLLQFNSYGGDLRARGRFWDALNHDKESLERHGRIIGEGDRATLRCMNNLAVDYGLVTDYERARDLYIETLQLQHLPNSGVSPTEVLIVRGGLARIVRLTGAYEDARYLGNDAVAFGRINLRPDHPWTLRTAKDYSIAMRRGGSVDEALDLARDVHAQELRIFGPSHPDTLAAAMNLANALRATDQVEEGFGHAMEAASRYPSIYGPDHPYNHGCQMNLALLLRVRGEAETARRMDEQSLEGLESRLGRDHHYSLTCALNLASDLAVLGDSREARALGEDVRVRLTTLLGETHPLCLAAAANLVFDLRAEGAGEEAEELTRITTEGYARTLGLGHPDTQAFLAGRRLDFDFDPPPI